MSQRLMRTTLVVAVPEGVERALLAPVTRPGWGCRLILQCPVKTLQPPVLLRVPRLDAHRRIPSLINQMYSLVNPPSPTVPNGGPLSVRIARGRPYSLNTLSITLCTCSVLG